MDLFLCAPFRTGIAVRAPFAFEQTDLVNDHITQAASLTSPTLEVRAGWQSSGNGELRYSKIQQDDLPLSARPIVSIELKPLFFEHEQLKELMSEIKRFLRASVEYSVVHLYDNTIGTINLTLNLADGFIDEALTDTGEGIDELTTQLASSVERLLREEYLTKFIEQLSHGGNREKKKGNSPFISSNELLAFFEESKSTDESRVLWVGRTLFASELTRGLAERFSKWSNIDINSIDEKEILHFKPGNSLVITGKIQSNCLVRFKAEIEKCINISQYFYSLFDVLNRNLRKLNSPLPLTKLKQLKKQQERLYRIHNQIETIEIEEKDTMSGLQGRRREVCKTILQTWHYDDLKGLVTKRNDMLRRQLEKTINDQHKKYIVIIESFLAFISITSIVGLTISLYSFVESKPFGQDGFYGIIELTKSVNPDILLTGQLMASILFIGIYVLISRRIK